LYPWLVFLKEEEEELANFIDIPLWNRNKDSEPSVHYIPHRLLKIEDDDTIVFLSNESIPTVTDKSLEKRDDGSTDYTFPNKTVKFFVISESASTANTWKIRTSTTANTADGTIRETITSQGANTLYTSEVIEGNFNGKFLTIENDTGADAIIIQTAVIIEPA